MLCEKCNKNEAKIHLIKLVNAEKSEIWLCENCAKDMSDIPLVASLGNMDKLSFQNILGGLFDSVDKNKEKKIEIICKNCGLTYSQFKASGQLGCSCCYESFIDSLKPMIKRVHGDVEHIGKIPQRVGAELIEKKKLTKLKLELQKAILEEEYERAAVIRDKIKEIESTRLEGEQE